MNFINVIFKFCRIFPRNLVKIMVALNFLLNNQSISFIKIDNPLQLILLERNIVFNDKLGFLPKLKFWFTM